MAKLVCDGEEHACIIRDASTSGLKVKLFAPLHLGGPCEVELADGERHRARSVWTASACSFLNRLRSIGLSTRSVALVGGAIPPHYGVIFEQDFKPETLATIHGERDRFPE